MLLISLLDILNTPQPSKRLFVPQKSLNCGMVLWNVKKSCRFSTLKIVQILLIFFHMLSFSFKCSYFLSVNSLSLWHVVKLIFDVNNTCIF